MRRFLPVRRALLVSAALTLAQLSLLTATLQAQTSDDPGFILRQARPRAAATTRASAIASSDTVYVGHTPSSWDPVTNPWALHTGSYRPGVSTDGLWDWDSFGASENDSLQGWWPIRRLYTITGGLTLPDKSRPWWAIDVGNQANYVLTSRHQNRTKGVVGIWHVDAGNAAPGPNPSASPAWAPDSGAASAWCGLRAHADNTYLDPVTGNPFNQTVLEFNGSPTGGSGTSKNFPGYGSQWDQLLYRDVRVGDGASLTVRFSVRSKMSTSMDLGSATRTGWFDKDPTAVTTGNFISSTDAGSSAPVDSFMVYVGVPANPTACRHADGNVVSIYDLQRRWFSEVLAIDAPYRELAGLAGDQTQVLALSVPSAVLQPMLDDARNGGTGDGGGIVRLVFRSKTNRGFDDEGTSYSSGGQGAVRIDRVSIQANGVTVLQSGFDAPAEINNAVEPANSGSPGPAVGQGYALGQWKSTGKPPAIYWHTHPLFGGDIGGGNFYAPLAWSELCGPPYSPSRSCNIGNVVVSAGDHDHHEAAGGAVGTAEQETMDGMMSPTVNLVIAGGSNDVVGTGTNGLGLTQTDVDPTDDYYIFYDLYAGIFNLFFSGNVWWFGCQSYPSKMVNGQKCWGNVQTPGAQFFNPDPRCFTDFEPLSGFGLVFTSNASTIPDSIRIMLGKNQQCFRFAVSLGCSPTGGAYFDNVSMAFSHPGAPLGASSANALGSISAQIWDFWNDAFPRNETPGLPGTVAFDTCAALLQTGINNAASTGSVTRPIVPGDTAAVTATGPDVRVDMVFRILPGPGNYVTLGNRASGLRHVPTTQNPVSPGDDSFWGQYLASDDGGSGFGSPGGHAGGVWDPSAWNAARCDSVEPNLFPVYAKGVGRPNATGTWSATYHESDPKFATLGIAKSRCFMVDTSGANNSSNITCGTGAYPPAWVTTVPASRTGYPGTPTTKEYTKILPDGLFTPGTHVEYFFRKSLQADPATFVMVPDTNFVLPQNGEVSSDGHRWQEFSVLPDAWKFPQYGGLAGACMLYIDYNDRRGNERTFIGVADSVGLNKSSHYGAHNGWHASGNVNYTGMPVGGDPSIAVWTHKGQAGTAFDMYGVKASESLSTQASGIGGRLGTPAPGLMTGKDAKMGPTPEMLRTYYRMLLILSGDLNSGVLGPFVNRSSDDVALIQDFLSNTSGSPTPRGIWAMGDGFAQSEVQSGGVVPSHTALITNYFATQLRDGSYQSVSGNTNPVADLMPTGIVSPPSGGIPPSAGGDVFGVESSCTWSNDLLNVNSAIPGAAVASYYQSAGHAANAPYVASVYAPSGGARPWISLLDGWDIEHLHSRMDDNSYGRLAYFLDVIAHVFPNQCASWGSPNVDVPRSGARPYLDFLKLLGTPVRDRATFHFGTARTDRVRIVLYDVAGRKVRMLVDRSFPPGEHDVVWDGANDEGIRQARGVYFAQALYGSGFKVEKKVVVLK